MKNDELKKYFDRQFTFYYYGQDTSSFNGAAYRYVIIEDGCTSIKYGAFSGWNNLTSVTIPSSIKRIGVEAFKGCSMLTSIIIPNGVTIIDYSAFSNCSRLASIIIPDSVTNIGGCAFENCSSLTSVTIPDSVTSIDPGTFENCSSLASVTIPDSVTSIENHAFYGCSSLTSVTIGNGVKSIAFDAFYGCSCLTSVTIPDSVTSIEYDAFGGCSSLESITMPLGDKILKLSSSYRYPFGYIFGTTSYTGGVATKQYYHGDSSTVDTTYYIPSSLKSVTVTSGNILYGAFSNCSSLTSITIGKGVTSIGNFAFYGCSGLTSVTILDSVTSIGDATFGNCSGLTAITIPDSVTSIENYAFQNCSSLTTITIPDSVKSIGKSAFVNCSSLVSVTIGKGVTSIGEDAFNGCSDLTSISIPDSVKCIGDYAFAGCSGLTSVTIGNGVTSIGKQVFYGLNKLKSIVAPVTLRTEGISLPSDCVIKRYQGKASIDYPTKSQNNGPAPQKTKSPDVKPKVASSTLTPTDARPAAQTKVPNCQAPIKNKDVSTFYYHGQDTSGIDVSRILSVIIENGCTEIGKKAFFNWYNLSSVVIPDSVKIIGEDAFYCEDSLLSEVHYTGDVVGWCGILFQNIFSNPLVNMSDLFINNTPVTELVIPNTVNRIGKFAFFNSGITSMKYLGTKADWERIEKGEEWDCLEASKEFSYTLHFTNSVIENKGYRSKYADELEEYFTELVFDDNDQDDL